MMGVQIKSRKGVAGGRLGPLTPRDLINQKEGKKIFDHLRQIDHNKLSLKFGGKNIKKSEHGESMN